MAAASRSLATPQFESALRERLAPPELRNLQGHDPLRFSGRNGVVC